MQQHMSEQDTSPEFKQAQQETEAEKEVGKRFHERAGLANGVTFDKKENERRKDVLCAFVRIDQASSKDSLRAFEKLLIVFKSLIKHLYLERN